MTVDPAGALARSLRGIVTVAFCPSTPSLLPAVGGRPDAETAALRRACGDAVAAMLAVDPEVVVVVGDGGPAGVRFGAGDAGDLRAFGVDVELPFDGHVRPGGRRLPLAHTVGAWLLHEACFSGIRVGVAPGDLQQLLRDLPGPVGVLAVGDGTARRSVEAPGSRDDAAGSSDAVVAHALAAGEPGALAALDPDEGLSAVGVATWRAVGTVLREREVTARLHYDDAPLGVGHLVADWTAR